MSVYSSFIHNHQKLETTKIFNKRGMDKQSWYISTTEYYTAIKGNRLLTHATAWMNVAKWKKPDPKDYIFYGSIYTTLSYWKRQNDRDGKQSNGCQGWWRGEVLTTRGLMKTFFMVMELFYMIPWWWIFECPHLSKLKEGENYKNECKFTICKFL